MYIYGNEHRKGYVIPKMNKRILIDDINQIIFIKERCTLEDNVEDATVYGCWEIRYNHFENQLDFIKSYTKDI